MAGITSASERLQEVPVAGPQEELVGVIKSTKKLTVLEMRLAGVAYVHAVAAVVFSGLPKVPAIDDMG